MNYQQAHETTSITSQEPMKKNQSEEGTFTQT